jgi:hypothetical protein
MNFPTSPTLNQTYSLGSKTWKWNGVAWDLQSVGLTSSMVTTALGYTPYNAASLSTDLAPYLTSSSASSTYLAKAGGTLTGNLGFSGTGLRITGDFTSNTTVANRVMFQSSTTNGNTLVSAIPNGTATTSRWIAFNNSDPANAVQLNLSALSTDMRIQALNNGSASALPLTFYMGVTESARIGTTGNWLIGTSTDNSTDKLQVNGTIKSLSGGFTFPDGSTQTSAGASTGKAIAMSIVFGG